MNHRVGKAEPDIGGGERGAGFTDQNGNVGGGGQPSEGTANAAERPRARVQRRSGVRLGQAPDGNANPAGTEVLESSTTSNAATPTLPGESARRGVEDATGTAPPSLSRNDGFDPSTGVRGGGGEESAPSTQMLRYLRRVDDLTTGKLRWGILTNGRPLAPLLRRSSLGLRAVLRDRSRGGSRCYGPERWWGRPDRHWLNVFLLVFRRDAFLPDAADERIFHQRAIKEGRFHHASTCVPSWTRSTSVSTASRIGTTSAISTPPSPSLNATRRPHTAPTAPATCASPWTSALAAGHPDAEVDP